MGNGKKIFWFGLLLLSVCSLGIILGTSGIEKQCKNVGYFEVSDITYTCQAVKE